MDDLTPYDTSARGPASRGPAVPSAAGAGIYVLSVIASSAAVLLGAPPLLLVVPVMLCAALGGLGPGLVGTVVVAWRTPDAALIAVCLLATILGEALRRARRPGLQEESLLRATLESTADGILVVDREGRFRAYNQRFLRMWGIARETAARGREETLRSVLGLLVDPDQFLARIRKLYGSPAENSFDVIHLRDGRVFERYSQPQTVGDEVVGRVWSFRDVTERERAEEALRQSEERFQLAMLGASDGLWDWSIGSDEVYYSPRYKSMLGYLEDELAPALHTWRDLVHPADLEHTERLLYDYIEGRATRYEAEFRMRHKDGHWVDVLSRASLVWGPSGTPLRLVGTHVDISERKRAVGMLREREARYRAVTEATPDGFWFVDMTGRMLEVNDAYARLSGFSREELLEMRVHDLDARMARKEVEALLRGLVERATSLFESLHRRRDGTLFPVQINAAYLADETDRVCVFIRDLTESKRAEEAWMRSQKLEALGTLAGGIAHDFNNVLLAISGNTQLAMSDLPAEHAANESLNEINSACVRAADMVRGILSLSRRPDRTVCALRLDAEVEQALRAVRESLPANIGLRTKFAEGLPMVSADAKQFHQIVANLVTNAEDAIGPQGGVIEFRLDVEGPWVRLDVEDNGSGMDEETVERVFDPFFTTRPVGHGMGLGLSIVHNFMKNNDGAIRVESTVGVGTTFHLLFPIIEASSAAQPAPLRRERSRGRVLYIDDEQALVFLLSRVLKRLGHDVTGHSNAGDALADFVARPHDFDLVVTDLSMPGMTGFDVAREMQKVRADIPLLFTSGYVSQEDERRAEQLGVRRILMKPDTVEELGAVIDDVLAG